MKRLITIISMIVTVSAVAAQSRVVKQDTINIRGYVYYDNGKPATGTKLYTKGRDLVNDQDELMDIAGYDGSFKLMGAHRDDTLSVVAPGHFQKYPIHGVRYLLLMVPVAPKMELREIDVTAPAVTPRQPGVFTTRPKHPDTTKNEIFVDYYSLPEFMGGNERFHKYVNERLRYPEKAVKAGVEGTVKVVFTIAGDGAVTNVRIVQGIGYGCDELVRDIVAASPKWIPAVFFGKRIELDQSFTVNFKLTRP